MLLEKRVAECLDKVGDDYRGRGTVKKHDLVHREGATKPCLIDVGEPLGRRIILQRSAEREVGALLDRRSWSPQLHLRKGCLPLRQIKVVELVRAYEMTNWTKLIYLSVQVRSQLDRGPDPQVAVLEPD